MSVTKIPADSGSSSGGIPNDGSVTDAKVAAGAAINADKTADGTINKVYTATEKTKLAGVAAAATAYTDENAQDAAAAMFTAGSHTGVSFTYVDGSNRIDAAVTGTSGISATIVDAKGDLIAGNAADSVARLPVGTDGQVLTANSAASTGLAWLTSTGGGGSTIGASTKTASYTLALGDAGTIVEVDSTSACTITVPTNASVAFPTGTVIEVQRVNTGMVAILAASGVTLRTPASVVARAQYSTILLRKRATNEWVVGGDVADRNVDPDWTVGLNSNADPLNQAPRAANLGCPVLRIEALYTDSAATLKPIIDLCVLVGVRPHLSAAWSNGISVPDLSNVVSWATAFGPGGSNWPGGSSPYALRTIELGNENSFSYKSGDSASGGYATIAQSYGTRALALQNALIATGTPVKTLIELEDGSSGSANWINNVVSTGGSALLTNMAGPTVHPYGPAWETKVNRVAGFLATAGSTKRYYVTETGLATDNGATLDDNYGFAVNLTYDQAATTLTGVINGMHANTHIRAVLIYQVTDLQPPGGTASRENFFGMVQQSGAPKGALTAAARTLLASSYTDAYSL